MADLISRLGLESGEFDSKIKRAGQELMAYSEHCKKMSIQMGFANNDAKDFAKSLGSMQTTSSSARGKINELTEAFVNLKVMYKNMTDAEKNSEFGKNLSASLDKLKVRINDAKKDLADVTKELDNVDIKNTSGIGNFGNIIDGIGHKMGITANLTELVTSRTALMTAGMGASVAAVTKATEAWASYNAELAKQDQITTVTTGLKGDDANRMTDQARALSDTYNVDFREAINAANTLMTQFGQTGEQAMSLIRDGMQGMIQGDGPKLLSMIQQYAPAFRDAGISASQLVAVIQNSEGGIFTDQNMNAIVMGIKNIRLMTSATSEALGKLGIDGEEMTRKLNDGSMSIFDALKKVAQAVEGTSSSSQAAGEVMQQVFGRQGAMAGTKLGEAIASLNLNLEETKRQTGEVGKAYDDLYDANVRLNGAIRDCFEYDGWDQMATGIKANLVNALAVVLESCKSIYDKLSDIGALKVFDFVASSVLRCVKPFGLLYDYARKLFAELGGGTPAPKENKPAKGPDGAYYETKDASGKVIERGHWKNGKTVKDVTESEFEETKPLPGKPTRTRTGSGSSQRKQSTADMLLSTFNKANGKIDASSLMDTTTTGGSELFQMLQAQHQQELKNIPRDSRADFEAGQQRAKNEIEKGNESALSYAKKQLAVADTMAGNLGNILSGLTKMGIELPEGLSAIVEGTQSIISIVTSIMTLVSIISTLTAVKSTPIFGWLLAGGGVAGGSRGRGVIHAAMGTVVPGNTYSGDHIPAMLNAGEVVLNRSQVSTLASSLQGTGMQNMNLQAIVTGEQLRFILNTNSRRRGKGEYVTSTHQ